VIYIEELHELVSVTLYGLLGGVESREGGAADTASRYWVGLLYYTQPLAYISLLYRKISTYCNPTCDYVKVLISQLKLCY
jgi:hypothetical protein